MADRDPKPRRFQGPKGTRDFYPDEMKRRRYIEQVWRTVSIRHGFDEIEGPTFESSDLYAVKSGEEILGELFQAFSGKSPDEVEQVKSTGRAPYALRPEFTPTLARMYAQRASALPRPTKWFAIPIHYRAERPQRGRLREFLQWNVDLIGDNSPSADAEVIATALDALRTFGLASSNITVRLSDRDVVTAVLGEMGVEASRMGQALVLLDRQERLEPPEFERAARDLAIDPARLVGRLNDLQNRANEMQAGVEGGGAIDTQPEWSDERHLLNRPAHLIAALNEHDLLNWCEFDFSIVRGLAYYTGIVFEIHDAGRQERAVAGGGRYDHLIESFGGPPTPAVGFGMGDVVLSLMLDDLRVMPDTAGMADCLGTRPDAFVIAIGSASADAQVVPLMARLHSAGLHARRSYKSTSKLEKLLRDATSAHARFAVMLDGQSAAGEVIVKDLDLGTQRTVGIDDLVDVLRCGELPELG